MIGEKAISTNLLMSVGDSTIAPLSVKAGLVEIGFRCDGNALNPDVDVALMAQISRDGGLKWRDLGGLKMNARTVASDLPNFPGSAYTLMMTHDGTAALVRMLTSIPQPASFALYVNF